MDAAAGERTDLLELVRTIGSKQPRVRLEVPSTVPAAWSNPVLARRVVEELVDNACRFSPPDSTIEVTVSADEVIWIRVRDFGPGIREEDRDRIFEPLEQAEALDSRLHEGVGIGLSLARTAARVMDGDLVLESTGPDGSTFLWTLPIAE